MRWRYFRHLRVSSNKDLTKKECSRQPSPGTNPFERERSAPASVAQTASLFSQTAAYTVTLHNAFCREMGFQFLGTFSSPFLHKSISRGTPFPSGRRHSTLAPTTVSKMARRFVSITLRMWSSGPERMEKATAAVET